jgi:hypothetical protein
MSHHGAIGPSGTRPEPEPTRPEPPPQPTKPPEPEPPKPEASSPQTLGMTKPPSPPSHGRSRGGAPE